MGMSQSLQTIRHVMITNIDRSRTGPTLKLWILAFALGSISACQQAGQGDTHEVEVVDGRNLFEIHCASCHGQEGRGDGPVASVLTEPPPDLTQLENKFDGVYPSEYVLRTVDGRHEFLAHGTRQMPIWGNIWREDSTAGHEAEVQRRLNALMHYLESIQEQAGEMEN